MFPLQVISCGLQGNFREGIKEKAKCRYRLMFHPQWNQPPHPRKKEWLSLIEMVILCEDDILPFFHDLIIFIVVTKLFASMKYLESQ